MDSTPVSMNSAVRRIQCFDECKVSMNSMEYCMNVTESSKFKPLKNTAFDKSTSLDQLNSQVSTNSQD